MSEQKQHMDTVEQARKLLSDGDENYKLHTVIWLYQQSEKVAELSKENERLKDDPGPDWIASNIYHGAVEQLKKLHKEFTEQAIKIDEKNVKIRQLEAERSEVRNKIQKRLDVVNGLMQKMKSTLYWEERKEEKDFLTELLNSLKTK